MSLPNTTLWGDILPGGPANEQAVPGIDTDQVIDEALPALHAGSRAELEFWTVGNLIEWLDEGVKRLAVKAGVFITRATTLTVATQAAYASPPRHCSTIHVSVGSTPLRPSGTIEMEARNPSYQTTPGTPAYWYQDLQGMDVIALTPVPDSEQTLAEIYEAWPETLDAGGQTTSVPGPAPLKGYLTMHLLAEAYGREGEIESPDIAAHCRGMVAMYDQMFKGYYGAGM